MWLTADGMFGHSMWVRLWGVHQQLQGMVMAQSMGRHRGRQLEHQQHLGRSQGRRNQGQKGLCQGRAGCWPVMGRRKRDLSW